MIHEVVVKDPQRTPVPWWIEVEWLKCGRVTFKPGLTMLFGPNGSGKSTLLLALARLFHLEQSGAPVLTKDSLRAVTRDGDFLGGLDVRHDGQVTGHFDADHRTGLVGGMAGFDYDFGVEGVENVYASKASAGQGHIYRLNQLFGKPPAELDVRVTWTSPAKTAALAFLKPNESPTQPTLLLDEPERSLSILLRRDLWRLLSKASATRQVIVATHDPLALLLPEGVAHFMETESGYRDKCLAVMRDLGDVR